MKQPQEQLIRQLARASDRNKRVIRDIMARRKPSLIDRLFGWLAGSEQMKGGE